MAKRTPELNDLMKIAFIQDALCQAYGLWHFELFKRGNTGKASEARAIGLFLAKRFTKCTNEQIAVAFLYRQTVSIAQAQTEIKERMLNEPDFKEWVLNIACEMAKNYKINHQK